MKAFEIPLINSPQTLTVQLGGKTYVLSLQWNIPNNSWTLNISTESNVPILSGIPLVTGADLLEQYGYLGLNGGLYAFTNGGPTLPPTFTNLGTLGHLYFVTP